MPISDPLKARSCAHLSMKSWRSSNRRFAMRDWKYLFLREQQVRLGRILLIGAVAGILLAHAIVLYKIDTGVRSSDVKGRYGITISSGVLVSAVLVVRAACGMDHPKWRAPGAAEASYDRGMLQSSGDAKAGGNSALRLRQVS